MKKLLLCLVICVVLSSGAKEIRKNEVNDDDFDEFEFDFENEEQEEGDEADAEDSEEEFDNIADSDEDDEEEFDSEEFEGEADDSSKKSSTDHLEIVESTVEIKPFWEAYFVEICIVLMAVLYFTNYLLGRNRNTQIAESWVKSNMEVLNSNFEVVGDDGEGEEPSEAHIVRRSDSSFVFWASGRANCDGLLTHIELTKRHDLVSIIQGLFKPSPDTISFIFQLSEGDMDSIICAVGPRKTISKVQKDYEDLSTFCTVRSGDKHGLPNTFSVLSETFDSASCVLSGSISAFLSKHHEIFMNLHVSDQYTGLKETDGEETDQVVVKKPERRIHLTFKLSSSSKGEESTELLTFALRFLDHIKGSKLSRETKEKTSKNRQKVVQNQEKLQHQARQEAAQQRREEKRKADKERLLHESDPEKARKLEDKEHKKQIKKNNAKMKQMKVRMG